MIDIIHSEIPNDTNTNKQLRHYDDNGNFIRLSVDETIANELNKWEGWSCSAGTNGLYIDFDGNIWVCNTASATTNRFNYKYFDEQKNKLLLEFNEKVALGIHNKNEWKEIYQAFIKHHNKTDSSIRKIFDRNEKMSGFLGNIFEGFDLPKQHISCPWKSCGCGADVFLAKAKTENAYKHLAVYNEGYKGQEKTNQNIVTDISQNSIVGVEPNFPIPYQILWDLGRNCNYDCSYCWPSVHNRDAPHKSLEVMKNTANKIITEWSQNEPIRWNFGGGEPTINPDFLEFIKYLKQRDQFILITSNGSRPRKYWKEAVQYINSINLSVHFEFVDETKLLGNIEEICNHFDEHDDDHWLEIKLMATPQSIERAVALREMIKQNTSMMIHGANGRMKGAISLVPIRSLGDSGILVDYNEKQLELLRNQ